MQQNRSAIIREIFNTLEQSKRAMHAHLYQYCEQSGLSASHIFVMLVIGQNQPVSLKQLSSLLRITPGAITQTIESLVQEKYIIRKNDEHDRRIVTVSLSKKGEEKVSEVRDTQLQRFTHMVAGVSNDELIAYLDVQRKILTQMESELQTTKKQGEQV